MKNYGWVQNTSNLSTVRDTVELVSEEGMNHNELMRSIYTHRINLGNLKKKWTWDARCRIKAVCATGMVEIDREKNGYLLTDLGKRLIKTPKADLENGKRRSLTPEEVKLFQDGLLTSPPVIRVLSLLNENRKKGAGAMSKYDIGAKLGFVGDVGFTHYEAPFVVISNKRFNDMEGDADKWARTIISWLVQVGWANKAQSLSCQGRALAQYTTTVSIDRVLQYQARSAVKYIPVEMLCSDHHPFATVIQQRRTNILEQLTKVSYKKISTLVADAQNIGIDTDEQTVDFDIINMQQAGIDIVKERSLYRLNDKIKLDKPVEARLEIADKVTGVEKEIEVQVTKYAETLPPRLVGDLIRYGYDGNRSAALFEMTVERFFSFMGYETVYLGQGHGRVADVIAKYRDNLSPKSYAIIIDAKAYKKYSFPVGDVRKMKEYIAFHGDELLADRIPNHAFAFVSMDFTNEEIPLLEIARDTAVKGTAMTICSLLDLGSKVRQQKVNISDLYANFTSNSDFCIE